MKTGLGLFQKLRKILYFIILPYIKFKCSIYYFLYGSDGVSIILERIPQVFIIPVLKKYGATIGSGTRILRGVIFHGLKTQKKLFKNLVLGENVYIGRNVLIDLSCLVSIGDDSSLGAGCQLWTHVGDYTYDFSDYHEKSASVNVGRGVLCWSMVLISPGVTIGDYARVAAGSVVVRDIEPKVFAGGVPAKFIKYREI